MLPRRSVVGDRSVADLVGERFGREVVDTLVEPLLGGVYAGSTDGCRPAPPCRRCGRRHGQRGRSLVGLRRHRAATAAATGPVFLTVRGGLDRVVDRLRDDLGDRVRTGATVAAIRPSDGGGWTVDLEDEALDADHVVLAVPARVAATLLGPVDAGTAHDLAAFRTASVATIALAYERGDDAELPQAAGCWSHGPRGSS